MDEFGALRYGVCAQRHMVVSKDENGREKSRPVPFVFLYSSRLFPYLRKKIQKWDEKREGEYPVHICGIPFLAGINLY